MIFSHFQLQPLLEDNDSKTRQISADLGISTIQVEKHDQGWRLPDGQILSANQVNEICENPNGCYQFSKGRIHKVEAFSHFTNRYYSLMPTASAPTMLISGIPMHRIKNTNPVEDTRQKIKALGKAYGLILDTTTGLGYTAIQAAKTAQKVITIELNPTVHMIARSNPWSRDLFANPKISKIIGSSYFLSEMFKDQTFNAIIHDPPTFNLAGELYSQAIYNTFFRILKPKGRLFHYIGNPESKYGATIGRGVVNRLRKAGFDIHPKGRAYGVLAKKIS